MPDFEYEALSAAGTVFRGDMAAETERELEDQLREQGHFLIRAQVRVARDPEVKRYTDGRVPRAELVAFTEFLAGGSHAGLPLLSVLEDVEAQLESRRLRQIVAEIRTSVATEGKTLSEALQEHPKTFTRLYVGAVQAGEATGQLDYVLSQLVEYLDWQQNINTQVRQAVMYPTMVLGAVALLILTLLMFVYPRLLPLLTGFDVELPLPTRILMGLSLFMQKYWAHLAVITAAVAGGIAILLRTERGQTFRDVLMLRLPIFGRLVREVNMARFVTYTALFYRTGVELIHGLTLVEQMLPNRVLSDAVRRARLDVVSGEPLASSFARTGVFPPLVLRSMALGESTGNLDEALDRAKSYYDRELPAAVRRMLTALQPAMVLLLGIVITVVALSIFLPVMAIYQSAAR